MEAGDAVELLRRQFIQLLPVEELQIPPGIVLKQPDAQRRIFSSMFQGEARSQINANYTLFVLKKLMTVLELSMSDPEEDV